MPLLKEEEIATWMKHTNRGWDCQENLRLVKTFKTRNFLEAFFKTAKITELSEAMNHHPELTVCYGFLKVVLWTHTCDGITELDIRLADLIDQNIA